MNDQVDVKRAAVSDVERDKLRISFTMSRTVTVVGKATSLGNSEGCAHGTKSDIGRCIWRRRRASLLVRRGPQTLLPLPSFLKREHDTTNLKPAASKTTTYWTIQQSIIIPIVEIRPQLQYPRQYPLFACSIAQLVFIDISLFLPIEIRLQIRLVERERFSNFRGQRAGLGGDGCCTRR
jgi:hypothetical protein